MQSFETFSINLLSTITSQHNSTNQILSALTGKTQETADRLEILRGDVAAMCTDMHHQQTAFRDAFQTVAERMPHQTYAEMLAAHSAAIVDLLHELDRRFDTRATEMQERIDGLEVALEQKVDSVAERLQAIEATLNGAALGSSKYSANRMFGRLADNRASPGLQAVVQWSPSFVS